MTDQLVAVERGDDGVAVIRLQNGKVNALSSELLRQLKAIAEDLTANPPGAVIVTGSERFFAAGADITEFKGPEEAKVIGRGFLEALNAVAAIPRMVIAAVSGFALGGGCELAMACDVRIASDTATFGQPEILLGIIPAGGGTQRLTRLVGPSKAKDLCLTGRNVKADEALAIGLADQVVPVDELQAHVRAYAAELAKGAVLAQALCKQAIDASLDGTLDEGLELEQDLFFEVFGTEDSQIGTTSFVENGPGKAVFTGR
jgi:enoyl-CoA hydratase/carnithine racemase